MLKVFNVVSRLLTDRQYFWYLATLVILGDVFLTFLIINYVPYTEIDWETYMVHIELYLKGQRDYSKITGPTGGLVYPAGHVHIHKFLYLLTDRGANIALAQYIYGALYITSLTLSCMIYYKAGTVPNWVLLLLPLSKRLHSIYALRLFNDCWSVVAMQASLLAYQSGLYDAGILLFSLALSVKMSILLYLPGIALISLRRKGLSTLIRYLITIVSIQTALAYPFLEDEHHQWSYISGAFDFSRQFLWKWTVNWRFLGEDIFHSSDLKWTLLAGHLVTLIMFAAFKWCTGTDNVFALGIRTLRRPVLPAGLKTLTPNDVTLILLTSNLIGILFARSLHYQFYSWYAQQTPLLAWQTKWPIPIRIALVAAIEYAWNVYPSTILSSGVLFGANSLLLLGLWYGRDVADHRGVDKSQ